MRIPLIEFETCIEPPILKKGRSYFRDGRVTGFEEFDAGMYQAVVAGSEDYFVELMITDGAVSAYSCSCPYDLGPVCKHLVAALFHLQQDETGQKKPSGKTPDKKKKAKRKTLADRVSELLDKLSHDELKQFVRERAEEDRSFRDTLLSSFTHLSKGESKSFYVSQIKAMLRSASGRHGFIDRRGAARVGVEVSRLLDVADKHMETGNYLTAVNICTAIMERLTEALNYGDDSDGDLGGNIGLAFEQLQEIAASGPTQDLRTYLLDYCVTAFEKKFYNGWDWHLGMLDLAVDLIRTEDEAQSILDRLETAVETYYEQESAQVLTYEVLKKIKRPEEAERYLNDHILNPKLRRIAIENAIRSEQYDRARTLANDGIRQHQDRAPGLVVEWREWLLNTAQAEGDLDEVLRLARMRFTDRFRDTQDYYELMRKHVAPDRWPEFVEGLVKDVAAKGGPADPRLADIYIKESSWERLFEFVKQSPSFHAFDHYEKYLKKEYASELAEIYAEAVIKYLDEQYNPGRSQYRTACRYIRRIKKFGSPGRADALVADLRTKYPRRSALLEELEMI